MHQVNEKAFWWTCYSGKFFGSLSNSNCSRIIIATKLGNKLPTQIELEGIPLYDFSSTPEKINIKGCKTGQNTYLDTREFLGINMALQGIQGEAYKQQIDINWAQSTYQTR